MVVAGVGQPRRAGELAADRAAELAARVDLAAGRDGGDRGDQQQRDQRRQPDVFDARRSALCVAPRSHRPDARRDADARVARSVSRFRASEATVLL